VFLIGVVLGLFFFLSRKWSKKTDGILWFIVTLLTLVLCTGAYLFSQRLKATHTCRYPSGFVIVGTEYTEHAKDYIARSHESSCEELLMNHEGRAYDVWTPASIEESRTLLISAYLVSTLLAALCIMSATQLVACATSRASAGSRRRTKTVS
jgi:hypothetical protein